MDGFPSPAVLQAVEENVAAGVTAFVPGRVTFALPSTLSIASSDLRIGDPPWQDIGTVAIGVGAIKP